MNPSLLRPALGIGIALHQYKAPTAIVCGRLVTIWSRENGVPFRGALGDIPIHRTQAWARPSVCGATLKDWAMVWTPKCFFHAWRARLMLPTSYSGGRRTRTLKGVVVYGGWVCEGVVRRRSMRLGAEGFRDTVLGVGSGAHEGTAGFVASLLFRSLSSGCQTGCR